MDTLLRLSQVFKSFSELYKSLLNEKIMLMKLTNQKSGF